MNESEPHDGELRTTSQPCQVHAKHIPESHINHRHHVWPLGDGGPNISDNIIVACPTGHYNIHDLLSHYKMLMGNVPYQIIRRYSQKERQLAKLGYDRLTRKTM